jgi:hypothetical protein
MLGSIVRVGALLAAPLRVATPSIARCLSMTAPSFAPAAASASSAAPVVAPVDAGAERSNAVNSSVDAKVASIFYEPSVSSEILVLPAVAIALTGMARVIGAYRFS